MDHSYTIGILGLASYATADLFSRIIDAFPAEKEWDRPRIIVDNNCVIPSRVRAILYNENKDVVIRMMSESMRYLVEGGADRIIVDCNTAHYFLPNVLNIVPEAKERVINLIENCAEQIAIRYGFADVGLIASEGVLDTGIYDRFFEKHNISVHSPGREKYSEIREYIEAVKQNKIDPELTERFVRFIDSYGSECIVLGCTELPVLYERFLFGGGEMEKVIVDPIELALQILVKEFREVH